VLVNFFKPSKSISSHTSFHYQKDLIIYYEAYITTIVENRKPSRMASMYRILLSNWLFLSLSPHIGYSCTKSLALSPPQTNIKEKG